MSIKNCLTLIGLVFFSFSLHAQSLDEIRNTGNYRYGIGNGQNYSMAKKNALERLSESISVHIQSEFEQVVKETNDNLDSYVKSVVNTYSSAVISNYEERVLKEDQGNVEVLVYITRENLTEIFKQREQLISDFIIQADRAEREARISDALRYYYWALVLSRSHPDNSKLRHNFCGSFEEPVMMGLYDRISRIFSFLNFEIKTVENFENPIQKRFYLEISYKGKPVTDIDYIHWVGDGYSGQISAKDGKGIAIVEGVAAKEMTELRLRVEYQYANKSHLEPEVKLMMESVVIPYFEKAEYKISVNTQKQLAADGDNKTRGFKYIDTNLPEYKIYEDAVENVVKSIQTKNSQLAVPYFSNEGYEMYKKLITNGNVTVLDRQFDTLRIMSTANETMVRSIPMLFSFKNNRQKFVEEVVFTFNNENKINSLSFSLSKIAIDDILKKPTGFGTLEEKYTLIRFMEDYKTAYSLKRQDYLEAIFDENALIIVGNVVKRTNEPVEKVTGMYSGLSNEQVDYIVLSKSEYMNRLKRVFSRNEFINIHFEDNQVRKTQKNDRIYGIQIAQHYYSSSYADKGYLFLMIDMADTTKPKIYVRSWQPEKNPDGSIFGLEDFKF
ncbi:MAG TPA: hypothetical protein PK563_15120 [Tenuifilaceae bacterium]|nr:hypothetical protein [Tenuifilaceae bacterium]